MVDEGFISAVFTPPPWAYPFESHVRGALGHVAYGVVVGTLLTGGSGWARCAGKAREATVGARQSVRF